MNIFSTLSLTGFIIFPAFAFAGPVTDPHDKAKELEQIRKEREFANGCRRLQAVVIKAGLNPQGFDCGMGSNGEPYIYNSTQSCVLVPGYDSNNPGTQVPANDTAYCQNIR